MSSRERVLSHLELHREEYTSGQSMARELGISRNSVWKAIEKLRDEGYIIDAVTNRGYRLIGPGPETCAKENGMSEAGIRSFLDPDVPVSRITILKKTESTNRIAKRTAVEGAPHGSVWIAEEQSEGTGHGNHVFYSPKGGIYMSVLLRPAKGSALFDAVMEGARSFTGLVARTSAEAIEDVTGLPVYVKPVNDLLLEGKKVCGILTEAGGDFDTGMIDWIVIGIGINFTTKASEFPPEIRETAGSIYPDGAAAVSENLLIAAVLSRLLELPGSH